MDDLMGAALHSMIHKQFELWNEQDTVVDEIEGNLFRGCKQEDRAEKVYARMIINSMEIAAEISAKVILEMLLTGGVIKPTDEKQLRKDILSVVKEQVPESGIKGEGKKTKGSCGPADSAGK